MQNTSFIKTLGIALLLACTAPVNAMDDLEEMIKNGTWDSKPARSRNEIRQDALLKQREERRRPSVWHNVRISNFTETPCSISYGGFTYHIRPDHKCKTSMGEGSVIEIRHRGSMFRLRTMVPEFGCFKSFAPELILEHLGEIGNHLPDPIVIETTTATDAAMVLFTHAGVPNMRLLSQLAKRKAMCAALALAPDAQPLAPAANAQENMQPNRSNQAESLLQECPFCLENLQQNDPNVSQYCRVCKGKMHARCLATIKESFNECPTCRSKMSN